MQERLRMPKGRGELVLPDASQGKGVLLSHSIDAPCMGVHEECAGNTNPAITTLPEFICVLGRFADSVGFTLFCGG